VQDELGITEWLGRRIDPLREPWYRFGRVIATLRKCVDVPRGATWLDVGCQMGQFLKVAIKHFGVVPSGIDDFEASDVVEVCRRYLNTEISHATDVMDGSWTYFSRQIDRVGFSVNEKFEFISALEVLEHFVDTDAFLEECRDHLISKGALVITTPNINSLRNRIMVPFGYYPAGLEYRTVIHHVRLYNAAALRSHIESHGFKLIRMDGVHFLPQRTLVARGVCHIDRRLSEWFPPLCSDLIAVFQKQD